MGPCRSTHVAYTPFLSNLCFFYASSVLHPTLLMYSVRVKIKVTFHRESARSGGNLCEWCLALLLKD